MTCKHNWVESPWGKEWMGKRLTASNEYFYYCTRCMEPRFVTLTQGESNDTRADQL